MLIKVETSKESTFKRKHGETPEYRSLLPKSPSELDREKSVHMSCLLPCKNTASC